MSKEKNGGKQIMRTQFENKVLCFMAAIGNTYKDDEERADFTKLELTEEGLTEDFTAMLMAQFILYQEITGDETDFIGFTHILNRLALQHAMKEEKEKEENEQ